MNLNVNSYMWLMATILYSIVPNGPRLLCLWFYFVNFFCSLNLSTNFFATIIVYIVISLS